MDTNEFNEVLEKQTIRINKVLFNKAKEYAVGDRLHNFKVAAGLQGVSTKQALAGMMVKHTVSVYDMCVSNEEYPVEMWDEKITDHINYLILLRAIVEEDLKTS